MSSRPLATLAPLVAAIVTGCALSQGPALRPKSPELYRKRLLEHRALIRSSPELRDRVFAAYVSEEVGLGLFSMEHFHKGEFILDYAPYAKRYHLSDAAAIPREDYVEDQIVRVAEEVYAAGGKAHASDLINHSCDSNAYLKFDEKYPHAVRVYARRAIRPGKQIVIDYRLFSSTQDRFNYTRHGDATSWACKCGAKDCTGPVAFQWLPAQKQRELIREGVVALFVLNELRRREPPTLRRGARSRDRRYHVDSTQTKRNSSARGMPSIPAKESITK